MRTFIAIPLPAESQRALEQMQDALRALKPDVRWTSVYSIHLTLKFLGEIDPALVPGLATRLRAAAASHESLALRLRGLGAFPDLRSPRVIWCGIEGELEKLGTLQRGVENACTQFGFPSEGRPFSPHLTLGRVRGKRNLHPLRDYIRIGSEIESGFVARAMNIYKSTLAPGGSVYDVLETIALRE